MVGILFPGVQNVQNIHPLVVHFPIAFLLGAALFYVLAWLLHKDTLATTAFSLLILGPIPGGAVDGNGKG
jgi:uncharacterized membrane protein